MSTRYPGGVITKTPVVPAGPYENGTAPGIWTLDQQLQAAKAGIWPIAGNVPPFIEDVFSTYLYTGNESGGGGQTQSITNGIDLAGKGGMVWGKQRNSANSNRVQDTVRGVGNEIFTNLSNAQNTGVSGITSFNSNGFTLGGTFNNWNISGGTYCSWTFREQPKFFDVVTYTGTGANRTIAHNLGSVPGAIWVKRTDTTGDWQCYHRSLANTQYMVLNSTAAVATGATRWNSTTPTDTVFSLGTEATVNASGGTYVAYLFAHDAGGFGLTGTDNVISCGSFTTSGTTTVTLGYEPQYVVLKNVSGGGPWYIFDTMRGMSLSNSAILTANASSAEYIDAAYLIPTATGFIAPAAIFPGGETFIYIAIRRGPMKVPTSGTSVFSPVARTGTGATATVSGFGFPLDAFLAQTRSTATGNAFIDRLRGGDVGLSTQSTASESGGNGIQLDRMDGYVVPNAYNPFNDSGTTIINWGFRRAPGFFDEVCYTGTGATATTQTHNLGAAPEFMIIKSRSTASTSWVCYHKGVNGGVNPQNYYMLLQSDQAQVALTSMFNDTAPTSSVFTVGPQGSVGASGRTYVAYLFATVAGVSKVGSYTGTGTTQVINCGFTSGSRFVLIKRTDSTGDWYVWDSARGIVAGNDPYLLLNSTAAEVTGTDYVDTAASGFEISSTAPAAINANGGSFIFLAIA